MERAKLSILSTVLLTSISVFHLAASALAADGVRAVYRENLASMVETRAASELDGLVTFYKDLHTHPELSRMEKESAGKIAQRLEAAGYKVTTGVGGTGVVGLLDNGPGPTVLIRGDMDALPITEETNLPYASKGTVERNDGSHVGVMHACGHDVHQTVLVGTAKLLADLREQWSGKLMIVAQPAEEIGAGAREMIEDHLFDRFGKPDVCIALHVSSSHPAGVVAYTPGWALANVDSVDITIFGRGGHGSRPHEAIDPIVTAAQTIVALQTIVSRRVDPTEPAVITVGSIHAGSKHNIIPNEAKLQITVRSYQEETRKILLDGIRQITTETARAMGCTKNPDVHLREDEFTPATYNDPSLTEAAAKVFERVLGTDHVKPQEAVMGGEDFSRYPKTLGVPGLIFWLGSVPKDRYEASLKPGGEPLPSVHSSKYYPDPAPTIQTGVKSMTSLALSLLEAKR